MDPIFNIRTKVGRSLESCLDDLRRYREEVGRPIPELIHLPGMFDNVMVRLAGTAVKYERDHARDRWAMTAEKICEHARPYAERCYVAYEDFIDHGDKSKVAKTIERDVQTEYLPELANVIYTVSVYLAMGQILWWMDNNETEPLCVGRWLEEARAWAEEFEELEGVLLRLKLESGR